MLNSIFVHLGSARAEHLLPNIIHFKNLFPSQPVHLILNNLDLAEEAAFHEIQTTFYLPTDSQNSILNSMAHDTKFRQGFWRFTVERVFALKQFHKANPEGGILHIESDVLLLPNFPFSNLEKETKLKWSTYNTTHDVSALLYSPSPEQTDWLIEHLEEELNNNHSLTDMTALSQIRNKYPTMVDVFPDVDNALALGLESAFDSAAIGMWLCGQDPRNHYGFLKLHNNNEFTSGSIKMNPANFNYSFSAADGLQIGVESRSARVYSLHIHSKALNVFSEHWSSELSKYVDLSKNKHPVTLFSWRVLIGLIQENRKQNTLIPFLLGLPYLYRLRLKLRQLRGFRK